MGGEMVPMGSGGTTEGFGTLARTSSVEMAAAGLGAQAQAAVQARYIIAMRQPRNWDQVRQNILRECSRPSFAHNKSTLYRKPIGQGIEGLGIRFVEMAIRCMGNVLTEVTAIFEDETREIIRVRQTDLEANLTYDLDIRLDKTVWRSRPADGGEYLEMRQNSQGRPAYRVPASEDEYVTKRNAAISKAIRTLGSRLIPGDIQEEAETRIRKVRMDKAAADPAGEKKRIIDAFGELGARVIDLEVIVGHSLDTCSPAEIVALRNFYGAIRDGETTLAEILDQATEGKLEQPKPTLKERMDAGKPQGKPAEKKEGKPAAAEKAADPFDA